MSDADYQEKVKAPVVAVVSGVGPYAGLDFVRKVFDNTAAKGDQEHASVLSVCCPSLIPDRTAWLLGDGSGENPAIGLFECARMAHAAGAVAIAVACNTAHAGRIFGPFADRVIKELPGLRVVNMIGATAFHIAANTPFKKIGLLATKGTHRAGVYREYFNEGTGFELLEPEDQGMEKIHEAIYHPSYGLKFIADPPSHRAEALVAGEIWRLQERGAETVILGCTELPLAVRTKQFEIPLVDPGTLAARELVLISVPERLKPLNEIRQGY